MNTYLISILIVFVPFVIGLVLFKYLTTEIKIFFAFVAYGLFNELLSFFLVYVIGFKNNMPLTHLYGLVTFLVITIFYRHLLTGFVQRKWIDITVALYTVYYLINSVFLLSIYTYPGVATAIGTIIILLLIILYFAKVMQEAKIKKLFAEPVIWISGALLVYYSVNMFFFVLFNLILEYSVEFTSLIVRIRIGFNVLVYLMISIGFLQQRKLQNNRKSLA